MSKLSLSLGAAALGVAALIAPAAPALAQNGKVSEIIVYGTDPCPRSTDDEIVVCARKPETERYRIPERLRQGGSLQSRQSWAARARTFETVGATCADRDISTFRSEHKRDLAADALTSAGYQRDTPVQAEVHTVESLRPGRRGARCAPRCRR